MEYMKPVIKYNVDVEGAIYECKFEVISKSFVDDEYIVTIYEPTASPIWQHSYHEYVHLDEDGLEWIFKNRELPDIILDLELMFSPYLRNHRLKGD